MRECPKTLVDKETILNTLFYISFSMVSFAKLSERSALIAAPNSFVDTISIIAIILFIVKFVLTKHKTGELMFSVGLMLIVLILKVFFALPLFILVTTCACVAMKNVKIETVLRIDLTLKAVFFFIHSLIFTLDYMFEMDGIQSFIREMDKGTAVYLYFVNPNTAGLIGTWIAIDMILLKETRKWFNYIIPTAIAMSVFLVTTSRAPFLVYIVYLILCSIKKDSVLHLLQRVTYLIFFVLSLMMVTFLSPGTVPYDVLNQLLSGRIGLSVMAYRLSGFNLLPNVKILSLLDGNPIDSFYIRGIVAYGFITLVLAYIPIILIPTHSSRDEKRISIIMSIYLFFESALVNIGCAPAYLIVANAVFNHELKGKCNAS